MPRFFQGSNAAYGTVPFPSGLTLPLTFAGFVRQTFDGLNREILVASSSGSAYCGLWAWSDFPRRFAARVRNEAGLNDTIVSPGLYADGVFAHVAAVFASNASRSLYVDGGSKVSSAVVRADPALTSFNVSRILDVNYGNATIADVGLWNAALTDDEIAALAKGWSPLLIRPGALLGYWPITGVQSPEPDRWRGRADMTLVGNPVQDKVTLPRIIVPTAARIATGTLLLAPTAPTYIAPADGATNQLSGLSLTWNAAPFASEYDVYFGTTTPPPLVAAAVAGTSYTPTIPANDRTVRYWKVVAKNAVGTADGPIWSFTLAGPPDAPTYIAPADGAVGQLAGLSLTWNAVSGALLYDVLFGDTLPLSIVDTVPGTSYTPTIPVNDGTVRHWQIVARNVAGSAAGPIWSFTLGTPPAVPTYLSPADGAVDQLAGLTLAWNPVPGATGYDVLFGDTSPPTVVANTTGTTYTPTIPANDGTVRYWRIVAGNAAGISVGPIWSFTLADTPPAPHTPIPPDGSLAGPSSLEWMGDGDSFDVYFGPSLVPSYADAVLLDGPSHYWRLNEATGLVAQDLIGGAHGAIGGGVTLGVPGALGDGSTAMLFDASGAAIVTAPAAIVGPCTIEAWVKFSGTTTAHMMLENHTTGSPAADRVLCWVQAGNGFNTIGVLYANGIPDDQYFNYGAWPGPDGQWHHLVAVFDGATCYGYVDGAPGFTTALHRAFAGHTAPIQIGAGWAGPTNGALDEIAIYPHALTAAQIAAHYAARANRGGAPPFVGTTTTRAWILPPLVPGTVYYWQIVATVAVGGPLVGPVWSFTATAPGAVTNVAPADDAIDLPSPVTLSWTAAVPDPVDVVFDVYFGPVGAALPRVSDGQTGTTYTTGALAPNTVYGWRVDARNGLDTTPGPTWTFATVTPTKGLITIGGIDVRGRTRIAGVSIRDLLADTPNTAAFTVEGTAPTVGQEIRIGLASLVGDDVIFGGYIDTVDALYEGRPDNRAWRVTAQDYVYGLNRRKVRTRYGQLSATTIALDLLAQWCPAGYTGTHIAAGLPVVTGGIDFTEEDVSACFARLAQRIGGYWYVDYARDVHLFLTESAAAPTPITRAARVLLQDPPIHWSTDLTQIRTRVYVEGGGSQARAVIVPGADVLPVTDGSWYSPSGGIVVSGPQRITYTGKAGIGGGPAPGVAAVAAAGNLGAGPYRYVTTTITDGNESPISTPSAAVTLPSVADPSAAMTATPVVGQVASPAAAPTTNPISTQVAPPSSAMTAAGALPETGRINSLPSISTLRTVDVGTGTMYPGGANVNFVWAGTFTNAHGETTLGGAQTIPNVSSKCNGEVTFNAAPGGQGITGINVYRQVGGSTYRRVGSLGAGGGVFKDTQPDSAISGSPTPPATNTTGTPGSGGLSNATYRWRTVFVASNGATTSSPTTTFSVDGIAATAVDLSNVPTSGDGRVIARRIYRTVGNGSAYFLDGTINDNTTTSYLSQKTDAALGAALDDTNRTGTGKLIPGATYAWQVSFATSSGETLPGPTVTQVLASSHDTVDLAALPISGDARVTKRRIYRTAAGGGPFRLEVVINDNTTTTYRSGNIADGSLGANPPTANTTGSGGLVPGVYAWVYRFVTSSGETDIGPSVSVTVAGGIDTVQLSDIAVSPDTRVTKRRVYRTAVNSGIYRLEVEINNNTATTYTSTKEDADLGADLIPGNTTAAGGRVALSGIQIGGPGTTARRIYRTTSGGAAYQYVAAIDDNITTTYEDNKSDASLGAGAPITELIQLVGIPASGPGAVLYEIRPGDDVNIFVQCDDVDAQAALAAIEGPPSLGIVEHVLQDRRLGLAEATATGHADLALFARPLVTIQYATRDPKTRSGKTVAINLPDLSLVGDFTIQTVEIDEIDQAPALFPKYRVTCSSVRFSFEDAVRRFQIETR